MKHINIEIKARSNNQGKDRSILNSLKADFKGIDHQIDTYFKVRKGRLKLREGNIENYLIYYERHNKKGPKKSEIILFKITNSSPLKNILLKTFEILVVVDKKREIYYLDNVKFHIDTVKNLGTFIEIEAKDTTGKIGNKKLLQRCKKYLKLLNIAEEDLVENSYSDLLLKQKL